MKASYTFNSALGLKLRLKLGLGLLLLTAPLSGAAETPQDHACAGCHRAIYENYEKTPMAQASGVAADGFLQGTYKHAVSAVTYTIAMENGKPALTYERDGSPPLKGSKALAFYLGSGRRGRTYLYQTDGYWFQSPINWYTRRALWDMAPGYGSVHTMPFTLPVDEGCLFCHASGGRHSQAGAANHFGVQPFTQPGITCARCHGDASLHVASGGKAPIINPARLSPARRDSICEQCHLEGETSVRLPGKTPNDFKPGDLLFDDIAYFVHDRQSNPNIRAVSQVEALDQSLCKRRSGDGLTCTTCHDPHRTIAASERVAWYRSRCLSCHTGAAFATQHHSETPDCTSCHMPRGDTTDIAHEQSTDHRILRQPTDDEDLDPPSSKLVPVHGSQVTPREYGLAYSTYAQKGDLFAMAKALHLLSEASIDLPQDPAVAFALGKTYESQGDSAAALRQFKSVLRLDPSYPGAMAAAGDLSSGAEALAAWSTAYRLNMADTSLAMRLAGAQCAAGDTAAAQQTLTTAVHFDPDFSAARSALQRLLQTHACSRGLDIDAPAR